MKKFESEGKPKAIYRNKITGSFLFWRMPKKNKKTKKPKVEAEEIEVEDVDELTDEEELDELEFDEEEEDEETKLDEVIDEAEIKEAYKEKYNVKTVKTESKKFREFADKYRESK